jgi:hypothetical protein
MKKMIFLLLLIFTVTAFSQEYTYNKVVSNGGSIKMQGTLKITDTLIHMTGKGFQFSVKVEKTLDQNGYKQFKQVKPDGSLNENVRYSISFADIGKKRQWTFITETMDDFSGTYQAMSYFLKPKDE